ncbi:MAG: putative alpha/beta superfamily hydrolase [Alteromonadaceae bacterium]|jgi:predicted alpha/beta superfamily hydrolase
MKKTFSISSSLVFIFLWGINVNTHAVNHPPVQISNSQSMIVKSAINNTDYEIQVALPNRYQESQTRYPVVYLLDANNDFPLVTSISRRLYQEDNLNPIIIVGISYKKDAYIHRTADYTPTQSNEKIKSGQANKFIEVIKQEVIPLIDSTYRTQTDNRTIAGHSLGGLFGAYQIIKNGDLFNKYIISSPSLWWDNFKTFSFAQHMDQKPIKVFVSVGAMEGEHMKRSAKKMINFLEKHRDKANVKTTILNGETHGTAKFRAYADSFRWLFKGDS